ncbi:MAG: ABC transporter ATP-binding protein [Vulcanimicrobiaceae bacterium]
MSARGARLEIEELVVRYPGREQPAIDGVSLACEPGTLLVLLGPSGCGKSTLLRSINRLVEASAGTIRIDGRDVRELPPEALRRRIGYAIQAVGLFPHLSVARNIALVPELLGWQRARIDARIDELLQLVRLEPQAYRHRMPRKLSGGEAQRVGVARALAAEPPLLLMDEPFGAVDALVRSSLQDELREVQRTLGTTVVFVTHDVDEALRLADRIAVLREGRLEQVGVPLALLGAPRTPYVAELLEAADPVRRLRFLRAGDALGAAGPAASANGAASLPASASLREALALLLEGAERIALTDGVRALGSIGFDDVRSALARPT